MGVLIGELDFHTALENLPKMPKQHQFISSTQRNAAYVGGVGSGKSVALMTCAILNAAAEPHGFSLIGRLNMPALESSTMKTFLEMVPEGYGEWADTKKTFTFSNGHQVIFKHLDMTDPKISGHIKSMNLSAAYVDEATEVSEEIYLLLLSRLRRKTAARHIIRLASNPAGHDWVWRHFFDPDRKHSWREHNLGITASSFENTFLPAEFIENLVNTYPPDWADRFIHGHFSDFSDLVYKEFTEDTHVWDDGREHAFFGGSNHPPLNWPVLFGIDIGSDIDPWAIALIAIAPNGMLFQFAEVYGNSLLIKNIAAELKIKQGERHVDGMAYDYANRQAALELAEYDISGVPAMKEVRPGLFKMAQYTHIDSRLEHPFNAQIKGAPRFYVARSCQNTLREISGYKWAKDRSGNPTGEPSHENSHSPDAIRYAIHTFRPLPERIRPPKLWENPALDAASREYWKDVERFKDKHDKTEMFLYRNKVPVTMQEWQRQSSGGPRRFRRPASATFVRAN
jgi:PBSX family phage terminase large subunit